MQGTIHCLRVVFETAAGNPENQDRGAVIDSSAGLVLVVADGAGGLSGGSAAAHMAVEWVQQRAAGLGDVNACVSLLETMDQAVYEDKIAGETTCALAVVTAAAVFGASVGDSGVWAIDERGFINLTESQSRKPFIGSGCVSAIPFEHKRTDGELLLLATDGLLKYTSPERILTVCRNHGPSEVPQKLIELVRYPSGALPDDVMVIFAYE